MNFWKIYSCIKGYEKVLEIKEVCPANKSMFSTSVGA